MKKMSLWKIIIKTKQIKNLINAIVELVQYASPITIDVKLSDILGRIRINLESIFGRHIDDI